ncbi:sensor histidine kinase [Allofustis seminis]|uniref:sensor histidine kinase n=1 Tax=Allofustis seminis TaxID=166939 RepID=UPI0003A1A000|nr:HAMP domain-containing sensor histidine kinase [Allofustis seminis]
MGSDRKGKSLKIIFFEYLLGVGAGLALAILLSMIILDGFYSAGVIVPANYTENQILKNRSNISNAEKFDESLIPANTNYVYLSTDGEVIQSNMNEETQQKAEQFHNGEDIYVPYLSLIEIKRMDGYVIISYQVAPYYTSAWMEKHFPKIDFLFTILLIFFCAISVFIVTLIWVKRIKRQLAPMFDASSKIAKQQLDFEVGNSNIKEFNDVLNSLEKMKNALSDSLRENWLQEENKRKQISALTHDLKTPISIVKGNAELLKDTHLSEEQKTYVDFILKSANRISDYSITLMDMNKLDQMSDFELKKVQIIKVVEKTKELAKEITSINNLMLRETINFKDGNVMIDIKLFERVIQNILSNAIQYAPEKSTIELSIMTMNNYLKIAISDQGQGFSNEDLAHGTEQFYQGDKSRHSSVSHGLGLYIAKEIVHMHDGNIQLENRKDGNGAKVSLLLPII